MKIQLIYFTGCPHVDASRAALREALAGETLEAEEIDVEDPAAPSWAHAWGSPTILIDGSDVAGQKPSPSSSACCRLYADGAPSVASIREGIASARAAHQVAVPPQS